jgi:hypothetical protein
MGTRNSTLVQIGGEYKVAQYCQWDGYPDGQGSGLINFLKRTNIDELKSKIKSLNRLSRGEVNNLWLESGHDGESDSVDINILEKFNELNPHLSRDCGGYQLLELIEEGKVKSVDVDLNFPGQSLWCEWCYVIDLDLGKFEVYKGFNKEPLDDKERFFGFKTDPSTEYKQVKHLISFDLYNLPDEDQFIKSIESLISDDE